MVRYIELLFTNKFLYVIFKGVFYADTYLLAVTE